MTPDDEDQLAQKDPERMPDDLTALDVDPDEVPAGSPTGMFYGQGPDGPAEEGGQLRDPDDERINLDDLDELDDDEPGVLGPPLGHRDLPA